MPKLEDGEKKFDSGEFGALAWYLMLAERLPLQDALATVDGWGGDAYVGFKRNGNSCARMAYDGDTPQDTKRMLSALRRWSAAAPGSPTKVSRAGDRGALRDLRSRQGRQGVARTHPGRRSTSSSPGPPSDWA